MKICTAIGLFAARHFDACYRQNINLLLPFRGRGVTAIIQHQYAEDLTLIATAVR